MKKSKKIMLRVLPIILVLAVVTTNVFGITVGLPNTGTTKINGVANLANSLWNTVSVIVQILAIAAIVLAGVRYMFASADTKADIKGQTLILVVGAILVFSAVPFAKFIAKIANDTLK